MTTRLRRHALPLLLTGLLPALASAAPSIVLDVPVTLERLHPEVTGFGIECQLRGPHGPLNWVRREPELRRIAFATGGFDDIVRYEVRGPIEELRKAEMYRCQLFLTTANEARGLVECNPRRPAPGAEDWRRCARGTVVTEGRLPDIDR